MSSATNLDSLVSRWQHLQETGQTVSLQELCADCPEQLDELKRRLQVVASMMAFLGVEHDGESAQKSGTPVTIDETSVEPMVDDPPAGGVIDELLLPGYTVLSELGRGGMGVVLRARDPRFGRTLAAKMMLPHVAGRSRARQRFLEEARLTGRLQHPGIPPVHELGQLACGLPFFTMKLIEGQTLATLLKERHDSAEDLPRFIGIFRQVCQTLAYVHASGVIHRDLKPANIMVGAFGEVQVMDWGLAKERVRLAEEELPQPAESPATADSASADTPLSRTGDVLGTPAYMAPEQARGEIHQMDSRSDVFGLGGILCEILTGSPPYRRNDNASVSWQAANAELADAFARLDSCGADAELLDLAKHCLAANKEDRPPHAGALAEAVERYEAQVQQRLRQAELEKAEAQIQAQEERKRRELEQAKVAAERAKVSEECRRRRVQFWLMGVAALFTLALVAAGAWYQFEVLRKADRGQDLDKSLTAMHGKLQQQHERLKEKLADALTASVLMSEIDGWGDSVKGMHQLSDQADQLAHANRELLDPSWFDQLQALAKDIQADEEDWQSARAFDTIRLKASTLIDGNWDPDVALREYPQQFRKMGLDVEKGPPAAVVAGIRRSRLRHVLVAVLDDWARKLAARPALQASLLETARHADPDFWRDQVRDPQHGSQQLHALAVKIPLEQQTPQVVELLAWRLGRDRQAPKEAAALLRRALVHHPRDFWLYFDLGALVKDSQEQVGCYRTAVALRPQSSPAYHNLAVALETQKDQAEALAAYQKAVALDPHNAQAWNNLGNVRLDQKDWERAVAAYQKALTISPLHAKAWSGLGLVRTAQKDLKAALAAHRQAVALDPQLAGAWSNLGSALAAQEDWKGAVVAFRKSVSIDPKLKQAWSNLGSALYAQKDLKAAAAAYQQALKICPQDVKTWISLGTARHEQHDLADAVTAYRKALDLDPQMPKVWYNLGVTLRDQKDLEGAVSAYQKAVALAPQLAVAWTGLGLTLYDQKELNGAATAFHKALAIDAQNARNWFRLGNVLVDQKDFKGAVAAFQKVVALDPQDAKAWSNLGAALFTQRERKGAIAAFQQAVALDPQLAPVWSTLGKALQDEMDLNGAVAAYRKAVALAPQMPKVWYNLGVALHTLKDQPAAEAAYRQTLALDPQNGNAWSNLGVVLAAQKDLKGATAAYQKAVKVNPQHARAWYQLGNALGDQKDFQGAVAAYRKALTIDPQYAEAACNLGFALQDQGRFAEALTSLRKGHELGSARPDWKAPSAQWVQECQQRLKLDQRVDALLQPPEGPTTAAELLPLALFCQRSHRWHAAARLFAAAFAAQPDLANDQEKGYCGQAASAAVRAAAGLGRDTVPREAKEQAHLRRQALDWLKADLQLLARTVAAYRDGSPPAAQKPLSPLEKLSGKAKKTGPADVLLVCDRLRRWQTDPDLGSVRDEKEVAKLPAAEQPDWRKLWDDVGTLDKQARTTFAERQLSGNLTTKQKEQIHEVQLRAGKTYAFDLESTAFDPFLRLEDNQGKKLAENDDIEPGVILNSRIDFTPPQTGTYRLIATAFGQRGTGAYTLRIREFAGMKK
jgi:tetratricopeptide (TPR) repeat protein